MPNTFTDQRDGKVYKTVQIGDQVWLAENLAYWLDGRYYEDNPIYGKKYKMLYNWETAMKICPDGWHLPSQKEWETLFAFAGGKDIVEHFENFRSMGFGFAKGQIAVKLKAKKGWQPEDGKSGNGTDDFGFAALPGGFGMSSGKFMDAGCCGNWWSSSTYGAWAYLNYISNRNSIGYMRGSKKLKFCSVRCIRN